MPVETPFHEATYRRTIGAFATGIAVVTALDDKRAPRAITVNSFTSVSLDPPLILFCIGKAAFRFDCFASASAFAVNILSKSQLGLSERFAKETDQGFHDLETEKMVTGCPVFRDSLAAVDCLRHASHDAGDHLIILGRIAAIKPPASSDPLVFFRGDYAEIRR